MSSNYEARLAPKTWEMIQATTKGTAMLSMPSGPIKCAGAPQKIAYLAADYWRQRGVAKDIRIVLVLPAPKMFGVPEFAAVLDQVVARYGIEVRFEHEVVEVDAAKRHVVIVDSGAAGGGAKNHVGLRLRPSGAAPVGARLVEGDAAG